MGPPLHRSGKPQAAITGRGPKKGPGGEGPGGGGGGGLLSNIGARLHGWLHEAVSDHEAEGLAIGDNLSLGRRLGGEQHGACSSSRGTHVPSPEAVAAAEEAEAAEAAEAEATLAMARQRWEHGDVRIGGEWWTMAEISGQQEHVSVCSSVPSSVAPSPAPVRYSCPGVAVSPSIAANVSRHHISLDGQCRQTSPGLSMGQLEAAIASPSLGWRCSPAAACGVSQTSML